MPSSYALRPVNFHLELRRVPTKLQLRRAIVALSSRGTLESCGVDSTAPVDTAAFPLGQLYIVKAATSSYFLFINHLDCGYYLIQNSICAVSRPPPCPGEEL